MSGRPRLVREGDFIAEVPITMIESDNEWSPCVSTADVSRLDEARLALRRGDIKAASRIGGVFELKPVAME